MKLENNLFFKEYSERLNDLEAYIRVLRRAQKTDKYILKTDENVLDLCYSTVGILQHHIESILIETNHDFTLLQPSAIKFIYEILRDMSDVEYVKKECSKKHPADDQINDQVLIIINEFKDFYEELLKRATPTQIEKGDSMNHNRMFDENEQKPEPGMTNCVKEVVSQGLMFDGFVLEKAEVTTEPVDERRFMVTKARNQVHTEPVDEKGIEKARIQVRHSESHSEEKSKTTTESNKHELPTITNSTRHKMKK